MPQWGAQIKRTCNFIDKDYVSIEALQAIVTYLDVFVFSTVMLFGLLLRNPSLMAVTICRVAS